MSEAMGAQESRPQWPLASTAEIMALFDTVDENRDGVLSIEELDAALRAAHLPTSRENLRALFSSMDANQSGGVDRGEFAAFVQR